MATTVQPRVVHGATPAPHRPILRLETTGLVAALLAQVLFGAANVAFVDVQGDEPAPRWLFQLHAGLGLIIVLLAIALLVGAIRTRERGWVVTAGLGLSGVVTAFVGGDTFVRHGGVEWASFLMATGCVVALGVYVRALVTTRGTR